MEKIKFNLIILISILSVLSSYFIFSKNKNIQEATNTIENVKTELKSAMDSITTISTRLNEVVEFTQKARGELDILQQDRELTILEKDKLTANTWVELQEIKRRIRKLKEQIKARNEKYRLHL